jgi:hypothetical protein
MKNDKETIAVDFDGVIHKYSKGWENGACYDIPVNGAVEAIKELQRKYIVIIFTARTGATLNNAKKWLTKYGIECPVTNRKPKAKFYIDDRAIVFKNWKKTMALLQPNRNKSCK